FHPPPEGIEICLVAGRSPGLRFIALPRLPGKTQWHLERASRTQLRGQLRLWAFAPVPHSLLIPCGTDDGRDYMDKAAGRQILFPLGSRPGPSRAKNHSRKGDCFARKAPKSRSFHPPTARSRISPCS